MTQLDNKPPPSAACQAALNEEGEANEDVEIFENDIRAMTNTAKLAKYGPSLLRSLVPEGVPEAEIQRRAAVANNHVEARGAKAIKEDPARFAGMTAFQAGMDSVWADIERDNKILDQMREKAFAAKAKTGMACTTNNGGS